MIRSIRSWTLIGVFLILAVSIGWGQATLNPRFHTYEEMLAEIDSLLDVYSEIMMVDTIGYSQEEHIPIIAVKISDNPNQDEDEPSVLYVGQVHAEEVLGNEIVMRLMNDILSRYPAPSERRWVEQLEIWIVPTANPEGLDVVMEGLDESFRKNKRDNVGDGIFRFVNGPGGDTSGVDINRNFDINWDRGDTLFHPGHNEVYDYYRGPAPCSEGETQALCDLGYEIQPVFSIIYHSSRTGNFSELVIYPWGWEEAKFPPDYPVISYEGQRLASMIPKFNGIGYYIPVHHTPRNGGAGDWFYQALGTVQFWIEVGTSDLQPSSAEDIEHVVEDNLPAAKFLLERTIGHQGYPQTGIFYMHVKDTLTNQPLVAEVRVHGAHAGILAPRMTDQRGSYYRPMLHGFYHVKFRKEGYRTKVVSRECEPSLVSTINVKMYPLPMYTLSGSIKEIGTGAALSGTVFITGEFSDTLDASGGSFSIQKPAGDYTILVVADEDHVPYRTSITLNSNRNYYFGLTSNVETVMSDGFEGGLGDWTSGGTGDNWGTVSPGYVGGSAVSESPTGEYEINLDTWFQYNTPLDLSNYQSAALTFWHTYDFEIDYDSGYVEISTDQGNNWQTLGPAYRKMNQDWHREWICLNDYTGLSDVRLRFHVSTDSTLAEQGWTFDDVSVIASTDTSTEVQPLKELAPWTYRLDPPYPNPFNASLVIPYQIAGPGEVTITATNILGQRVFKLQRSHSHAGDYKFHWNGRGLNQVPLSSGIYFITFKAGTFQSSRKALLLK